MLPRWHFSRSQRVLCAEPHRREVVRPHGYPFPGGSRSAAPGCLVMAFGNAWVQVCGAGGAVGVVAV